MHVETPLAHNWPGGEGLHWVLWWLELHLWIFEMYLSCLESGKS